MEGTDGFGGNLKFGGGGFQVFSSHWLLALSQL